MDYKDLLAKHFSHPVHAVHGPKAPADQLKAFLWAISHDLEDGLGEVRFDDAHANLLVMNPDDCKMVAIPLADLADLGYAPAHGQSAEDFLLEQFQDWEATA